MPNLHRDLKPKTKKNYVGIEIECLFKGDEANLTNLIDRAGISDFISLASDGSLRSESDYNCIEIRVLATEAELNDVLNKLHNNVLTKVSAKVNASCGLHVHLDMRWRKHRIAYYNLVDAGELVTHIHPKERLINKYCSLSVKDSFHKNAEAGHYQGISSYSFKKHQTIEVRIHEGTVDPAAIINWVDYLKLIVDSNIFSGKKRYRLYDADTLKSELNMSPTLCQWLDTRIAHPEDIANVIEERIYDDEMEIEEELNGILSAVA